MKKGTVAFLLLILCVYVTNAHAQFKDNFSDGDFTSNPAWGGNVADWAVNANQQLQSNNTVANAGYYLSTASTLATMAQWDFWVNLTFNTSSANYVDVFLTASQSDVSAASTTGYFVRIGNTDDEVCLYRKDAGSTAITKIIDGVNGITNFSNNTLRIRVIRAQGNQFTLLRDATGGTNYVTEGSVTDAAYTTSAFFGMIVKQSTASFFQRHFFDDFEVKAYVPDVTPPALQSVTVTGSNTLDVLFNEPVEQASAQNVQNYSASNGLGNPVSALRDGSNPSLIKLAFATHFVNRQVNTLTVAAVKDLAGNAMTAANSTFSLFVPRRFDVLIDEIMADPTPVVALPNYEYIELRNVSGQPINLQGWRVATPSATSGAMASYVLPHDSMVVITGTTAAPFFAPYGRVLAVTSFPALDNDGTVVSLVSRENVTIHAVEYSSAWYQNAVKANGGWSLEMVDIHNPCSGGGNWRASTDSRGGTPGTSNSVNGSNPDRTAPAVTGAAATLPTLVTVMFSEPLDSNLAATAGNYVLSDGITVVSARPLAPLFKQVQLQLNTPLAQGKVYTITVSNLADCAGNTVLAVRTARVGLAQTAAPNDIVINEILFDPRPQEVDYVEIYNRSQKIIDLKDVMVTNRSSTTGNLGTLKPLAADNLLCFPGDFFVLTENDQVVQQGYVAKSPQQFINISSMPSYPDNAGTVVLLNVQGDVIDQLAYDARWHFKLLDNKEGIALERIDYNRPTQDPQNWHSAASTAGYGTPTYQNSQFRVDAQVDGEVTIAPKVFSPDNDGTDDFTMVHYRLAEPNFVANITVFDASGRPVKVLAKNATLAQTGSFRWDGLDDKLNKLPMGTYIIYTEVFNLAGKRKMFKNTVVLARRL